MHMQDPSESSTAKPLTRREWLSRVSIPALAATMVIGAREAVGQTSGSPAMEESAHVYNVRAFGAKGDGKALDTKAVQAAIDTCTAAGGGTVLVPTGTFL